MQPISLQNKVKQLKTTQIELSKKKMKETENIGRKTKEC